MLTNKKILIYFMLLVGSSGCSTPRQRHDLVLVGPLTAFNWPMYIAKEAGYYDQYGLSVKMVFANHPTDIAMLVSGQADVNLNTLEHAMELCSKDPSFVIFGSPLNKWLFALVGGKDIRSVRDLKGKRIGITQLGGSTYNFARSLLLQFGLTVTQVKWVSLGSSSRAAALASGQVDATMLSAPAYFALEDEGYRVLANLSDYDDIQLSNVLLLKKSTIETYPELPELLIKAHAAAVKRFYDDPSFAIKAYLIYDKQDLKGLQRVYEDYSKKKSFDRVPYITTDAVRYVMDNSTDAAIAADMKKLEYRKVISNNAIDNLVRKGFFEQLFGPDVRTDQARKSSAAVR